MEGCRVWAREAGQGRHKAMAPFGGRTAPALIGTPARATAGTPTARSSRKGFAPAFAHDS